MSLSTPTSEDIEELLLSCRYGDLDDIRQFIDGFGADPVNDARDENGNTVLHMVCANGHIEALEYLLPLVSTSLLSAQNNAQSTPLHWAALNSHLAVAQALVRYPQGPGISLLDIKNAAGRSPLGEAENVGWEEGAKWFVEVMNLDEGAKDEEVVAEGTENVEVEIQDAEGRVAKMTLGPRSTAPSETKNDSAPAST
ncbi:cytoplasmic protein [Laetiporus sulphureus 93-53]|uniref:Cytoplasmic protein n=1 Tax=Laetiporus sulphureus 93-53 TaxID=1314785 RepID=A0A165DQV9_9APHY|nr:cytoplasmic protein [Laetiporus sulphureus 93-53]KZT05432.1 cytoplasmic protein [Laetiporus sulphureus 93-53]